MFARTSLAAGFVFFGLITFGCKSQPAAESQPQTLSAPPAATGTPTPSTASQPNFIQPAQPDDASLLARKTSEYADNLSRVLAKQPSGPPTRPSIVQWVDTIHHPADSTSVQPAPAHLRPRRINPPRWPRSISRKTPAFR